MLRCSGKLLSLRTPPDERYTPAGSAVCAIPQCRNAHMVVFLLSLTREGVS
nr:MAG TPA: hypothetical protein [Caudoviricetes sp.]